MRKYNDFKEYMEDNYLDLMLRKLEPYIISRKNDLVNDDFYDVSWVEICDGSVCGVTFKDLGDNWLEIRTSVDVEIEFTGKTRYKGSNGFFYLITGFGDDEYVIEYTETEEAARKGLFWDADWFYGKPEKVIPEIRAALLEYIKQ